VVPAADGFRPPAEHMGLGFPRTVQRSEPFFVRGCGDIDAMDVRLALRTSCSSLTLQRGTLVSDDFPRDCVNARSQNGSAQGAQAARGARVLTVKGRAAGIGSQARPRSLPGNHGSGGRTVHGQTPISNATASFRSTAKLTNLPADRRPVPRPLTGRSASKTC